MPLRPALLKMLGNETRLRILLVLARHGGSELTIYKIAKFSGLDRKAIRKHIHKLVTAGLVKAKNYGPIALYSLNYDNFCVQKLVDLFNGVRLLAHMPPYYAIMP